MRQIFTSASNGARRLALLAAMCSVSVACTGGAEVSVETREWKCSGLECTVTFALESQASSSQTVTYMLRAHRVSRIHGGEGSRRNEVVGARRGQVELHPRQSRNFSETLLVTAKPSQIVVTAWIPERS